jgi:hypothetical protein
MEECTSSWDAMDAVNQWMIERMTKKEMSIWFTFEFHPPNPPLPRYMHSDHDPAKFANLINELMAKMGVADRCKRMNAAAYCVTLQMSFVAIDAPLYQMVERRLQKLFRESSLVLQPKQFTCSIEP